MVITREKSAARSNNGEQCTSYISCIRPDDLKIFAKEIGE